MCTMRLAKPIRYALRYALDTIAPPDPAIREIEDMDLPTFASKVATARPASRSNDMRAYLPYKNEIVRNALVELKMYKNVRIVRLLAAITYDYLAEELSELSLFENFSNPLLVPVPMTRKDKRKRGWNQCELLAREISRVDRSLFMDFSCDALVKIRQTDDQVGKDKGERALNLVNSFAVSRQEAVRGRNVIVLDDIITTGSTLGEARRALLQAGARVVVCVAVAY